MWRSRGWTPSCTPCRVSSADSWQPARRTLPGQPLTAVGEAVYQQQGLPCVPCSIAHASATPHRHSRLHLNPMPLPISSPPADLCAAQLLAVLQRTSQLMQDTSEVVAIIFA